MDTDVVQLVSAIRDDPGGSTRAAARLMSLLEDDPVRITELYADLGDWPEPLMVLGVTGPPGAGKSTLLDQLIETHRKRYPHSRLGVIAVDPSSPFSKGAVMGDRVRMMRHATDPMVFVRSLASRGHLGGLAQGVKGVLRVMGLLQCRLVLIETVGVGQSEMEVSALADLVAIILAPGQGDGIQLLKSGLMETGDVFVVNKSDRNGAAKLHAQLCSTLNMTAGGNASRHPPSVCTTSALRGEGIDELLDLLQTRLVQDGDDWRSFSPVTRTCSRRLQSSVPHAACTPGS